MSRRPQRTSPLLEARIEIAKRELRRGPLSAYKLKVATGWAYYTARDVLRLMFDAGDVVEVDRQKRGSSEAEGPKGRIYALVERAEQDRKRLEKKPARYKGIPAGRIEIPQFRWGSTRLW